MLSETIASGVKVFTFALDTGDFATCIVALRDADRILLIDSGYERHAAAVAAHLTGSARVVAVVLSHEHEDHVHGCRVLPDVLILAAEGFPIEALDGHDVESLAGGAQLQFGEHRLCFRSTPGHSPHHLVTLIIDDIAHVGDLLVHTGDGRPTPPYLGEGDALADHVGSLEYLRSLDLQVMVPGHGPIIRGRAGIERAIALRLYYLTTLQGTNAALPLDACLPLDTPSVSRRDFHASNLQKLGRAP